jgi:hypothetical protein
LPALQRGAVIGQFESSRQATHLPLAQNGSVLGHIDASMHCTHFPRLQSGISGSRQSAASRQATHSPVAPLQKGASPVQLSLLMQPPWQIRSTVHVGALAGQLPLVMHCTHSPRPRAQMGVLPLQ